LVSIKTNAGLLGLIRLYTKYYILTTNFPRRCRHRLAVEDFNPGKISPYGGSPGLGFREKRLFLEQKSVILWIFLRILQIFLAKT